VPGEKQGDRGYFSGGGWGKGGKEWKPDWGGELGKMGK